MVAQVMLLNKVLDTQDYSIISTNNLIIDYFFDTRSEFNFIKSHVQQYNKVPDKVTFLNTFPEFSMVTVTEPTSYLLEQLYKEYDGNFLAQNFNAIKRKVEAGEISEALTLYKDGVGKLQSGKNITCTDLLTDTSRYEHYLDKTRNPEKYYYSTGFPEIDELTGGVDRENEDMVCCARPGQGKTWVMLKGAVTNAQQGATVGIYEGEISVDKLAYRIDTLISGIENTSLMRGNLYVQRDYQAYIESINRYCKGKIKILTPNDVPGESVTVDTLEAFIDQNNLDILYVDQYSLLEDNSYAKSEADRVGNIAKKIKQLQVKKRIPIISVAQMNRTKNENNEQDTTQVAGSDKIPQYATTVLMLDQKYDEDKKQVELTINITKARDGGDHNKITYVVNFNTGSFNYIPIDGDEISSAQDFENIANSYAPGFEDSPY